MKILNKIVKIVKRKSPKKKMKKVLLMKKKISGMIIINLKIFFKWLNFLKMIGNL